MKLLKNKIAIITGSGRGIGKAVAHQYHKEGATVILAEFDEKTGKEVAALIGGYFVKTDISDEKSVTSLFKYVKSKFSRLDILVNNAGILRDSTLKKLEPDHFDSVQGIQNQRWTITSTKVKLITDQLNLGISAYPMITKTIKSKNTKHVEAARLELLHFIITHKPDYIVLL